MADTKIIDLANFKGATIHLHLKGIVAPFFIVVSGVTDKEIYYIRKYDKEKVEINLPKHPAKVKLDVSAGTINQVIIDRLKIYPIPYTFNKKILMQRDYPVEKIKTMSVDLLPNGSPACFIPSTGTMIESEAIMSLLPQPAKFFIRTHELGHYYYGRPIPSNIPKSDRKMQEYYNDVYEQDELECDKFSLYHLANKGYNFSGILYSIKNTLNPENGFNYDRIMNVYNEIKTIHKKNNL